MSKKKKPMNTTKEQGRTGIAQTFYVDADIIEALKKYRDSQKIKPSKTAFFNWALRKALKEEGFLPNDPGEQAS